MDIVADSGSTKTEWGFIQEDGTYKVHRTAGINPVFQTAAEIRATVSSLVVPSPESIKAVYFYGAGCAFEEKKQLIKEAFYDCLGSVEVEVRSDLWGAARALCGSEPGIVCILGTGSNSCYYDGKNILENVPPLGYILGDEGSGAVLGRKLLAEALKGLLPEELKNAFKKAYPYSYPDWIARVYREAFPNRFLAGLSVFIYDHIEFPEMEKLVLDSFEEFVVRNVLQYRTALSYPVSFTGSVAYYFKEQMQKVLEKYGLVLGSCCKAPLEGLIHYHRGIASNTSLREG